MFQVREVDVISVPSSQSHAEMVMNNIEEYYTQQWSLSFTETKR